MCGGGAGKREWNVNLENSWNFARMEMSIVYYIIYIGHKVVLFQRQRMII